ncbi:MAG: ATP-dependent DNA ligase [Candidatus Diapherotrites archaeon]|nr:ATP-dependent DNA ligase [Candidatus Diapherotrites archaeon]
MQFRDLARVFDRLESTSSRLEMIDTLASLFSSADGKTARKIVYLLQGRVAAPYTGIELGIGEKLAMAAISRAYGVDISDVEREYKEKGDLGLVAEALSANKKQMTLFSQPLTVDRVYSNFYRIATASGYGSQDLKLRLLVDLLNDAEPLEARYIIRIPLGKLRLGVGDATIIEALALAVLGSRDYRPDVERAYNLCSDLGYVAELLYEKGLEGIRSMGIVVGIPIRPALAQRAQSAEEIIARLGRCAAEAKYDGFRCQIHKKGDQVWIFSRRMENMTDMFPDLIAAAKALPADTIVFEGEAIAVNENTGEFYPFQMTIQRKRKYGVSEASKEYPLYLFAFDIMYLNGETLIERPYRERRQILEGILRDRKRIQPSEKIETDSADELEAFFESCVERGLEGIVAKDLNAPYIAGARKWSWIKLKRSYRGELSDTIDVVILGYYKGRGKRSQFGLGGILVGVYDPDEDSFKTIAKVGSGFTEEQLVEMKKLLDDIAVSHRPARVSAFLEPDVWVEPRYVITVTADEITRSPNHTAGWDGSRGYALRFPRIVGWVRDDKGPEDATTVQEIIDMYKDQKHVQVSENEA